MRHDGSGTRPLKAFFAHSLVRAIDGRIGPRNASVAPFAVRSIGGGVLMLTEGGAVAGTRPGTREVVGPQGDRLRIDPAARSVHANGREVILTPTEYDVLACLAERAGTIVATRDIIEQVWGEWYGPVDHVFVHVHHIRRKLGDCAHLLVTKRTLGYLLHAQEVEPGAPEAGAPLTSEYLELLQEDSTARGIAWIMLDERSKVSWASATVTPLLGWWPADIVGRHPWDLVPDGNAAGFIDRISTVERTLAQSFDTRARRADGGTVDVTVTVRTLHGMDGHRLGVISEWRLRPPADASGGELSGALAAECALPFRMTYDGDLRLVSVEPHQAFLGWEPHHVIGTHFSLSGLEEAHNRRILAEIIASGELQARRRMSARCTDGSTADVDMVIRVHREDGSIIGYTEAVRVIAPSVTPQT